MTLDLSKYNIPDWFIISKYSAQIMELDRDMRIAAEIAKIKFPETMIISGDNKGGTPLESLIGATIAKQLQTSQKK